MASEETMIQVCEVVSIDDPKGCDRIKVRMIPYDSSITSMKDLPFVFPLLPKVFSSKPKVGEAVLVFTATIGNGGSQRYYIGPIIPQVQNMDANLYNDRALSYQSSDYHRFLPSIYKDPNANGIAPEEGDVAVVGRNNSDILLKDNDLQIRCGIRKKNDKTESGLNFNNIDPAFIKLRYDDDRIEGKSSVDIVADNINILGGQSPSPSINIDNKELIGDNEFKKVMDEAHKLPYGDILIDFLGKLRSAFLHHTHPFSMLPPCMEQECLSVANYDLDSILSNSVRIS